MLGWFTGLQGTRLDDLAADLVRLLDPRAYALLGVSVIAVALARGRLRHALVATAVLAGAGLTARLLKPLLAAPRPHDLPPGADVIEAAWPSGHVTGALALALCLVLVAPGRLRPAAAAAGGAFAAGVALAVLLLGSHWPSDVLGGVLVAGAWTALGLAALKATDALAASARAPRTERLLLPIAAVACAAAVAVAGVVLARPASALDFAHEHTAICAAAIPLAAAGVALVGSVAVRLSRG